MLISNLILWRVDHWALTRAFHLRSEVRQRSIIRGLSRPLHAVIFHTVIILFPDSFTVHLVKQIEELPLEQNPLLQSKMRPRLKAPQVCVTYLVSGELPEII